MIARVTARHVRIPMRYRFGHAKASRAEADNVVVRVELEDGAVGFGEGVPREYVTGETIASVLSRYAAVDLSSLLPPAGSDFPSAARDLWRTDLAARLAAPGTLANAAACALEVAILDAHGRRSGRHVLDALDAIDELSSLRRPDPPARVRQCLTIAEDIDGALERAGDVDPGCDVKLKVGFGLARDRERFADIRRRLGDAIDVRLDANGAWGLDEAIETLGALAPFRPSSVEEPIGQRDFAGCAALRSARGVPVMLDESLCSPVDARASSEAGAADLWNLRLSKCGGLLGTLRLAAAARTDGVGFQLGCMVGETGLLASLGRAVAARVDGVRYLESTVPRKSLERDLTDASLDLEPRTRLTFAPTGPGLGVAVNEDAIRAFTVAEQQWPVTLRRR